MTSTVHAQYGGYTRACPSLSSPGGGAAPAAEAWAVIPSICVSEAYSSNVYYAPKSPGLKLNDYVTTISPSVRVQGGGEYAAGYVEAGGFGQTYVRNPSLNYIGFNGTVLLDLDNSVRKLFPNAGLKVFDSARYTPTPPGFVNPSAGTSPSEIGNSQNAFAQGVLAYRTNTWTNVGNVVSSYAISPLTTLKASYTNSIIRYGSSQGGTSTSGLGGLFNTTSQTASVGGSTQVSELDTMSLTYAHGWIEYQTQAGTTLPTTTFQTDSGLLGWSRTLTPSLKSELAGGVIVINPGLTSWTGNVALIWNVPNHRATLSYARTVFPSVVGTATPLIGNIVSLAATHDLSADWHLTETASYINSTGATSSTQSGVSKVDYTTYSASVSLYYYLTRIWSSGLSADYLNYDAHFGLTSYSFPVYMISFGVRATLY